jgi:hypothetical protein
MKYLCSTLLLIQPQYERPCRGHCLICTVHTFCVILMLQILCFVIIRGHGIEFVNFFLVFVASIFQSKVYCKLTVLSVPSLPIMETTAFPDSMKYIPSAGSPCFTITLPWENVFGTSASARFIRS